MQSLDNICADDTLAIPQSRTIIGSRQPNRLCLVLPSATSIKDSALILKPQIHRYSLIICFLIAVDMGITWSEMCIILVHSIKLIFT